MPRETYKPLRERFDHLLEVFRSTRFLRMEGLGNEVPFFICPFDPREAEEAAGLVGNLMAQLDHHGIHALHIDLFDLTLELLAARGLLERVLEREPHITKGQLKELLQNVLDPEKHLIRP